MTIIKIIDTETACMKGDVVEYGEAIFTGDYCEQLVSLQGSYVRPNEKISFEAMAIHHVTEDMVANAPTLEQVLSEHNTPCDYIVAHNLTYEEAVLPESFFPEGVKRLCTLKLARTLYKSGEDVESHKLGVLFYQFGLNKDERVKDIQLHSAQFDCLVTGLVLEYMLRDHNLTLDQAYNLLYDPTVCKGGKKYPRGTRWEDIIVNDYDYVEYTFNNVDLDQEEKLYLGGLLSQYQNVKLEQVKTCSKKKYAGRLWSDVVKEDLEYVNFLLKNGHLKGDELEWVKGLLAG